MWWWDYDSPPPRVRMFCGAGLKLISHHHGGMVPFFAPRFDTQRRNFKEGETVPSMVA